MTGAAVTGIGLVTPLGTTTAATLDSWRGGVPLGHTAHVTRAGHDVRVAAIHREAVRVRLPNPKLEKYAGWPARLAMAAAAEAAVAAGLRATPAGGPGVPPDRIGVYAASGTSGLECDEFFPAMSAAWPGGAPGSYDDLGGGPLRLVDPHFALRTLANGPAAFVAMQVGASGPSALFVHSACAAVSALQCAVDDLALGRCEAAVVVACDSLLAATRVLVRERAGVLDRAGAVLSEGAAALVLQRAEAPVGRPVGFVTAAETLSPGAESGDAGEAWQRLALQAASGAARVWGVSVDGAVDALASGLHEFSSGGDAPSLATALGDMGAATPLAWVALALADRHCVPTLVVAAEPWGLGVVMTEPAR